MSHLLSLSYWLNTRPGDLHISGYFLFLFLILAFSGIIVLFQIVKKRKNNVYFKIWRGANDFAIGNLVIAVFLLLVIYSF